MKKLFAFLFTGFLLLVFQSIWRVIFSDGPAVPDLVFILVVYSGMYRSAFTGAILAFVFGFFSDVLWGLQPGLFASVYTMVFFFSRLSGRRFYMRSYMFQVIIIVLMTVVAKLFELLVLAALGLGENFSAAIWATVWRQMLWNGLLAIPVVLLLERIEQATAEEHSGRYIGAW